MNRISVKLNKWREYFRSANSDIFDIIEYAVMVAAVDHQKEFQLRRDRIAELLFTCKVTRGFDCDKIELAVPNVDDVVPNAVDVDVDVDKGTRKCRNEFVREFEGKCDVNKNKIDEMNVNEISNDRNEEVDALSDDEIDHEESRIVEEILQIKEIIDNSQNESESDIYESLKRLQLITLSVEILKATNIARSINTLRRHDSKKIRHLVKTLRDGWMDILDKWVDARAELAENNPQSVKASVHVDVEEEEGLPSPPLDDMAFLPTHNTSIKLSKFFDGLDDEGNVQSSREPNKKHENSRKTSAENNNPVGKQQFTKNITAAPKDKKGEQFTAAPKDKQPRKQTISVVRPNEQPKKQTISVVRPNEQPKKQTISVVRPNEELKKQTVRLVKPLGRNSGPGNPTKPTFKRKVNNDEMKLQQKSDKSKIQMRHVPTQQNKLKRPYEDAANMKFEATRKKLQKCYQEEDTRHRKTQVMELGDIYKKDLHKQGPCDRNPQMKPDNHKRHLVNRRP